jgi:Fe-S-cluster-containing hydrogenase component 2
MHASCCELFRRRCEVSRVTWALPGAILFLLGLLLLLGYFLSRKVFSGPETGVRGADPSGASPCNGCNEPGCGGFAMQLLRGGSEDAGTAAAGRRGEACAFGVAPVPVRPGESKALVRCVGRRVAFRYRYSGAPSCRTAARMAASPKACANACLGFGDCVRACPARAIRIEQGTARVVADRCDGCRKCLASCPLGLIDLIPARAGASILCKGFAGSPSSEPSTCPDRCTTCGLCVEACPEAALEPTGSGLPRWIQEKCNGCGACAVACPQSVILVLNPL